MRDDIHKSAPVARHWQNFLGRCVREADRGDRAFEGADAAVRKDLKCEVGADLVVELLRRCTNPKGDLFNGRFEDLPPSLNQHVLAQRLVSRLQHLERTGAITASSLHQALVQVVSERMQAVKQSMVGHILKEPGTQPKECVRAMAEAIGRLSASAYAQEMITNAGQIVLPVNSAPQLDEVLSIIQ